MPSVAKVELRKNAKEGLGIPGIIKFDTLLGGNCGVNGFELCDANGTWHPAIARIRGNAVVCHSAKISEPVAVRYGWAPHMPEERPWNLYNRAGLPASPFISHPDRAPYDPMNLDGGRESSAPGDTSKTSAR